MESFLSGKKRKHSSGSASPRISTPPAAVDADTESTDFKLALLSSLHPSIDQSSLLDVLLAHEGSVEEASASLTTGDSTQKRPGIVIGHQSSLSSYIAPLPDTEQDGPSKKSKLISRRGKTLHLYSPEDVAAHTPCSIIHNFLPPEEASYLLKELLEEAITFERTSFKLFDNVVQSPHTACLYVEGLEEQRRQKTEYVYNGGVVEVCHIHIILYHT
jgi:hypothetical protein